MLPLRYAAILFRESNDFKVIALLHAHWLNQRVIAFVFDCRIRLKQVRFHFMPTPTLIHLAEICAVTRGSRHGNVWIPNAT